MSKIEWSVPENNPWQRPVLFGRVGALHVATIMENRAASGWGVNIHLSPLPDNLDAMTWNDKASERQAKATAQRIVNVFTKILTGEGDKSG